MRILFVNHTGSCSGAENAMLRLLEGLPAEHARAVACPAEGPLKPMLLERGYGQMDMFGTDLSFGLHPTRTVRGSADLVHSAWSLRAIARRFGADVIHANSTRAGLIAVAARRLGGPPVVVQCHDHLPLNRAGWLTRAVIARGADEVVAVTDRTASHFNEGLNRPKAKRVYISIDHSRFSPVAAGTSAIRSELGLPESARLLVHVAQITPWKGQDTSIRALPAVRRGHDAHLLLVGEVSFASQRFDNEGYEQRLDHLTEVLGVRPAVHRLGQRKDVAALMATADLLLLPSWDEPFGLVAAEAMAVGTPVLATERGGIPEYLVDRVHGRLLPPDDPAAWAVAAKELLADPDSLARMGAESIRAVQRFNDENYARDMLAAYDRGLTRAGRRPRA